MRNLYSNILKCVCMNSNLNRITNEEKRYLDRMHSDEYNDLRWAAEVHRTVSYQRVYLDYVIPM